MNPGRGGGLDLPYQPFYCEENAWWLCAHAALGPGERHVIFLVSPGGCCPVLCQRLAPPGGLIAWDYHVIVLDAGGRVWDQDSRLPSPSPGLAWLDQSLALADRLPARFRPGLRVIPGAEYRRDFTSDRSHMRDRRGRYLRPPPPWPPIGTGMTLPAYLDAAAPTPGRLLDLPAARGWMAGLASPSES